MNSRASDVTDAQNEAGKQRQHDSDIENRDQTNLFSVLDLVPDVIITIDEAGSIASFSLAAEKLFGYKLSEVIGQNVKMLMPEPYRTEHDDYLAHYRQSGEKKIIGIGREVEAQRKDGSVLPINLAVNEFLVNGRRMFTAVVHDLSELRQAQAFSDRLGRILDRSLNEIYVFESVSLRFVQVNYGARRNMGYSSAEFRELTPIDIKPQFTQAQFEDLLRPLRNGAQEVLAFKTVHQRKDGSTYPVEIHLQLMRSETPPVFAAVIQDITEIERSEAILRQSQKMEAIGQLTGGIAHDFNNLLSVIMGNNELLGRCIGDDPRMNRFLDNSTGAAERAAQLTSQLLTFARRQPLDPKIVDPNELVLDMMDMLHRTLGETIEVEAVLEPNIGRMLADPVQVHNALLNLAINARDAMPNGGRLIIETSNVELDESAVRSRADAEPGHYVRLSVRDTGTGMTPKVRSRALEPFFTTKEQGKGTGLGLSMVHGFAKQSGGHVDIYSEVGLGTAISLYLPNASAAPVMLSKSGVAEVAGQATGETVMVVEDDPNVREVTVDRLEHLGYRIVEAQNAQAALDMLAAGTPVDVLLTDVVMPGGMTGIDLVEHVRRSHPTIKAILSSGYAPDGSTMIPAIPWLRKPYTLSELAQTLREVLDDERP
ncbi:MAG: PAS domain S-box protein [Hyphomicrobiaceae bacterium]